MLRGLNPPVHHGSVVLKLLPDEKLFAQLVGKHSCYLAETLAYGTPQSLFCRIIKYWPGRGAKSWSSPGVPTLLHIWEVTPIHPVATLGSMSTREIPGTEEYVCKGQRTNGSEKGLSYKCLLGEINAYVCKTQHTSRSFSVLRMHDFDGVIPLLIQHCNKECLLRNAAVVWRSFWLILAAKWEVTANMINSIGERRMKKRPQTWEGLGGTMETVFTNTHLDTQQKQENSSSWLALVTS